jgi:phage terminase large subunit-like protein
VIAELQPVAPNPVQFDLIAGKATGPRPFTLPHFRAWSARMVLDSGDLFRLEPFQAAFVTDVLASDTVRVGARSVRSPRYSEVWDILPEGNGKSTLVALLALYCAEFEPFAAIPVAAASREQAEIIYRQAEGFVLRSPRMHESVMSPLQLAKGKRKTDVPRFVCLEGYRRINHYQGGRIQVFAADDRTGDGIIPTRAIIDEPHRQRNLGLYRTWAGKLNKRRGQIIAISTAGEPGSDFEMTRERIRAQATKVTRRGAFARYESNGFVLHEWALEEGMEPDDYRAVKRANPFSGITVPGLREKHEKPTMTPLHWSRFVCNRPTRTLAAAITEGEWESRKATTPIPPDVPLWVGLDVAWQWDTTAAVPLWARDEHFHQLGPATILVPPRDGSMLDPHAIENGLLAIHSRNPITTVVMDMSKAEQLAAWIEETIGAKVVQQSQSLGVQVREYAAFMAGIRSEELWHSGDPGLTTHVLNAVARGLPLGDLVFARPKEGRENSTEQDRRVIDALKAAAMVYSTAIAQVEEPAAVEFFTL